MIQARLRKIEEEIKAQKAYFSPSLGALQFPETAPSASYSGSLNTTGQDLIVASFLATFTRKDSVQVPPLVDFAFDAHTTPTFAQDWASQGYTMSGHDLTANEDVFINGYVISTGTNSVTFQIDVKNGVTLYPTSSGSISLQVQAYSMVEGTLTLTRIK